MQCRLVLVSHTDACVPDQFTYVPAAYQCSDYKLKIDKWLDSLAEGR